MKFYTLQMMPMKTAVNEVRSSNITVVGKDTNLLVLLIHHATVSTEYKLYFRSDRSLPVGQRKIIQMPAKTPSERYNFLFLWDWTSSCLYEIP